MARIKLFIDDIVREGGREREKQIRNEGKKRRERRQYRDWEVKCGELEMNCGRRESSERKRKMQRRKKTREGNMNEKRGSVAREKKMKRGKN